MTQHQQGIHYKVGDVVDDNILKDLNDFTPTNENPKEKEVESNESQTIVTPEIVPSPSDPNITLPHIMSRICVDLGINNKTPNRMLTHRLPHTNCINASPRIGSTHPSG